MLAHLDSYLNQPSYLLPFVCLIIGMVSSIHCVGMCGPILLLGAKNTKKRILFHFGRLTSYLGISLLFHLVGVRFFSYFLGENARGVISYVVLGTIIIFSILLLFSIKAIKVDIFAGLRKQLNNYISKTKSFANLYSFLLGSLGPFLPCGVLYTVIISLSSIYSLPLAIVGIVCFWLGTLPVFSFAPKLLKKFKISQHRVIAMSMIIFSLVLMYYRLELDVLKAGSCH